MKFKDRADAGRQLAGALELYKRKDDVVVIGLPRGGVVTAFEVAQILELALDIIVTRKIGAPMQPELAVGALTQDGEPTFDRNLMEQLGITQKDLEPVVAEERQEAKRRLQLYRGDKLPLNLHGKTVIMVDDGIATGATMRAAIKSARSLGAEKIVVAVPVSPSDSLEKIKREADDTVCLYVPAVFFGVGGFYEQFAQTEDEQVIRLLRQ